MLGRWRGVSLGVVILIYQRRIVNIFFAHFCPAFHLFQRARRAAHFRASRSARCVSRSWLVVAVVVVVVVVIKGIYQIAANCQCLFYASRNFFSDSSTLARISAFVPL